MCVAIVAIQFAAPIGQMTAAEAEIWTCSSPLAGYFDGFTDGASSPYYEMGALANIYVRYGAVCDTDTSSNNVTAAWSMIANRVIPYGWAQAGYIRWYNATLRQFAQQSSNGSLATTVTYFGPGGAISAGQHYDYWDQWVSVPGCGSCIRSNYNTFIMLQSGFDPFVYWTQPFTVQFLGETKHTESDIPGLSATAATYSNISVQDVSTGNFVPVPCSLLDTPVNAAPSRWGIQAYGCYAFNVWTEHP